MADNGALCVIIVTETLVFVKLAASSSLRRSSESLAPQTPVNYISVGPRHVVGLPIDADRLPASASSLAVWDQGVVPYSGLASETPRNHLKAQSPPSNVASCLASSSVRMWKAYTASPSVSPAGASKDTVCPSAILLIPAT